MSSRLVMPTRVLVVGGGGREHALAWKLAAEPGVNEVIVAPGSAGIATEPRVRVVQGIDPLDGVALVELARREAVELAVIGPEAPLAAGVADALLAAGVPTFGPTAAAARIESSKAFCREIARAAGVRIAEGRAFETLAPARAYAHELAARGDGVVVKADGLAAGKGVTVCSNAWEADVALDALFADDGPAEDAGGVRVVVEERLEGEEASLIALCDGSHALALSLARDHKRLADGDRGPNTGGMGAFSPLADLPDEAIPELVSSIHRPILAELTRRGSPFVGALYAGLMLTRSGPVLLECNARFGDPETQVLVPRLATALGPLLLAAARGALGAAAVAVAPDGRLPVTRDAAVGVVLAAAGYPETPRKGDEIEGLDEALPADALVFHAGTRRDERRCLAHGRRTRVDGRRPGARRRGRPERGRTGSRCHLVARHAAPPRHRRRPRRAGSRRERPVIPRYTLPEMAAIWSESARFERMLEVELAVVRAQVARGQVPADALVAIEAGARIDLKRIAEIERQTDHDVVAFVSQVAESVGPEGRFLHLGLTSSDVVDTALALQLRAAGQRLLDDCDQLLVVLVTRARAEAMTIMMGRTHSVHAEPTTFGLKVAGWAFELDRGRRRLASAIDDVATGKISGPVGTYSHLAPDLEAEVLAALGLHADPVSTQIVQRDRHAALLTAIAVLGGSLERFATEIRNLQHTEIGEVQEPFRSGQKGSSAMPHKRNPILSERIAGLARLLRGYAQTALENQPLWHERDISHSSAERVVLPDSTTLLDYMLVRMTGLVEGLAVRSERMRENIERGLGLHASSRVLSLLVEEGGLPREEAYAIVQRASLRAADERRPLRDLLAVEPVVARKVSLEQLDACFDDAAFLRHVPEVIARLDVLEASVGREGLADARR